VALQASDPYAKRGPVPKKKAAPKRKKVAPKRPSGAGIAGVSVAVAKRHTTPKKVVARTRKAGRPAPRRAPVDPIDAILAKYDRIDDESRRGARPEREFQTGGPDLSRLQLLKAGGDGNSIGGFLKNLGRGGVDVLTSVPASAQLVAEAAAYPVVAAVNVARGERPGPKGGRDSGIGQRVEAKLEEDLRAAGTGVKKDYAYRYGPLFSGDVGEFGSRFYDDPLPTILDVAGAKSIIGRSPNAVSRVARAVAPETKIGMRAARNLSTLSKADREVMAQVTGRKITPGAGGRYRAPTRLRTQIARPEPGKPPIGIREIEVPRRPYSGDAIARARQKAVDKARTKAGARLERAAESRQRAAMPKGSRQAGLRERATARAMRRFTPEGRIANIDKRSTLDLQDLHDAKAEVNRARNMPGAAKAIARLKPDKNVAGQTIQGLSVEEAAFAVHRMDMLGEVVKGKRVRGGLSANDLLDRYIRTVDGNQRAARAAGKRTENAAQQLQAIKALRERPELLELTDMKNPAVRRVAQAVEESRRLGRIYQAQAVKSGIITNKTRKAAAMRDSAIGVGGARWGADEIRKVTVAARRKTLGIKKAIVRAEKRGDAVEVQRLKRELSSHIKATKGRISAIKNDAVKETPELVSARSALAEAEQALREAKSPVDRAGARVVRDNARKRLSDQSDFNTKAARAAAENQRRMYRRDKAAAENRKRAEARGALGDARNKRRDSPREPSVKVSFNTGARFGRADVRQQVAPRLSEKPRRVPIIPKRSDMVVTKPGKRRMERGLNAKLRVGEPRPKGITATQGRAYFTQLSAQARHAELRRMSQSARKADREFVRAQIEAARKNARPLSPSEEAALRRNLTAAEKRYSAAKVRPIKPSDPVAKQAAIAERAYQQSLKQYRGTPSEVAAATRARDRHFARVSKMEREALGFTSPRRPELVGKRGVYVPDKRIDVTEGYTGPKPGGRFSGPDKARKSTGSLKSRAGQDLNPNLVLHQAARASENYTGRISAQALDELMKTAAYIDPTTGKALTGNRLRLLSQADSERVRLVHAGNLRKALKKLDELEEGKFLDDATVRQVFTDRLPEGARATDYVAISKDAADVWTGAMTRYPLVDKALNYWKGGILALSPRWYVNNTFGLALQYSVMTGGDFKALARANRHAPQIRRAMEKRFPNLVKDTMAADLTGGMDMPRLINFGFRTNAKLEEFWRRGAAYNRLKRAIRDEGGRFRKMTDAEVSDAIMRMPEAKIAEIVRDVEFFIGNYRKFNKLERNWIKRVIPFYSWMRVISRLTFALPFRSPVRAAALTLLETASTAGINPNDKSLPYYARGAIRPGGNIAVPTWGLNPWQTMAGSIVAAGEESPSGALAQEALGWMHPGAQLFTERATGINNFGRGVITPPGEAPFGQDPSNYNPIGAGISRQAPRIPLKEALLQSAFPGQVQVLRKMAQGNRQAFDQTETPDLLIDFLNRMAGGERDDSLYAEDKKGPRGRRQSDLNAITAWFGIPTYRQDDAALLREAKKQQAKYLAELRKRKQARAKR
jgi:hypothetical protein